MALGLEETDKTEVSECALLHFLEENAAMKCAVISLRAATISDPPHTHTYTLVSSLCVSSVCVNVISYCGKETHLWSLREAAKWTVFSHGTHKEMLHTRAKVKAHMIW